MIYVISQFKSDYDNHCTVMYGGEKNARWIHSVDQLRGLTLYADDVIDVTANFSRYPKEERLRFEAEIALMYHRQRPEKRENIQPIKIQGAQYAATLPDGYEWRMMEIGRHGLRLIGCHPKEGVKMYRWTASHWLKSLSCLNLSRVQRLTALNYQTLKSLTSQCLLNLPPPS